MAGRRRMKGTWLGGRHRGESHHTFTLMVVLILILQVVAVAYSIAV